MTDTELRAELARVRTFLWRAMEALGPNHPLQKRFRSMFVRRPCIAAPSGKEG